MSPCYYSLHKTITRNSQLIDLTVEADILIIINKSFNLSNAFRYKRIKAPLGNVAPPQSVRWAIALVSRTFAPSRRSSTVKVVTQAKLNGLIVDHTFFEKTFPR